MQTQERRIAAVIHKPANLLFGHTHAKGKFSVLYVFFCNTSYSRSCDSYFCFIYQFIIKMFPHKNEAGR